MFAISGTYPSSFVTQIFHNGQPSYGGDRKTTYDFGNPGHGMGQAHKCGGIKL